MYLKPVRLCEEITLWSRAYLEKLVVPQLGKKFPSPSILLNLKVHYHVQNSPPLLRILSLHSTSATVFIEDPFCSYAPILFSKWCLSLSFLPTKFRHASIVSLIGATCPAPLILRDLITLVTFGEEYKSWSSSLCNFLQSPSTSCLWGPIVILSATFLNALSLCTSLTVIDKAWHPFNVEFYVF